MRAMPLPKRRRLATRSPKDAEIRDRAMRDAFREMRPVMARREPGRVVFDNVIGGKMASCWVTLCSAMEVAADHGVPRDRLKAFARAFDSYADRLDAERHSASFARPMSLQLVEEAHLDAAADVAQAELAREESLSTLDAFIRTGRKHVDHMVEAIRCAQQRVFHRQQQSA